VQDFDRLLIHSFSVSGGSIAEMISNSVFGLTKSFVALLGLAFSVYFSSTQGVLGDLSLPEFTEPIKNITTSEGSNVELSCYVKYLGGYRVCSILLCTCHITNMQRKNLSKNVLRFVVD
jgi:hypothetical protein